MASYDAQINILVAGQRNINNLLGQLNQVEDAIAQIESRYEKAAAAIKNADIRLGVIGRQQPRGEGGRLAKDPNRQARFAALADSRRAAVEQRLARMNLGTALRAEGSIRNQVEDGKEALRQAEKKITLQQRLNSAVELFETRQKKLIRGGGGRGLSQGLQEQAREIQAAFQAAGGGASRNLALINSLATGLGRIVERQNEFNRAQSLGKKGFEAGRRLQERIEAVAERGVIPSQRINRLKRGAAKVLSASDSGDQQAYSEAVRAATAAVNRVERESRKLARDLAKNATRSPILGGTNFPGSPKAVEAQRRAQEVALRQSQKGYPASPILGTAAMAGSPRAVQAQERAQAAADRALRAQERAAKVAETAADKALRESQKGFPSSPLLGAAGMAGSPKALQAQERNRAAVERRMATQRRAEERAAKLQQQAAAAAERAADRALEEARKGYPSSPVLGGASMGGSPRWKTAQESAKRKVETAARATERAADKAITEAQKGYPASPILGTATMVGSPRAAQAQERSRAAADRALRAQERVAKAAEAAVDRALKQAQQGYPTSPVSGSATMVGSPRALQAQQRAQVAADRALRAQARAAKVAETAADKALAQAQKGFPSSPILGTAAMAGSPRAMQAQERARAAADRALRSQERAVKAAQSAADKALEQAKKGYPASPILGTATTAESPRWKRAQQAAEKKLEAAAKATGAAADKALLEAQKGYPASPILGTATMAGSPRWKAAQERLAGRAGGTAGSGLQEALQSLQEARGARESFFGGASPAEGIDKIVREFNTGKTGGAASGAAGVADSVTESFTTGLKTGIPQAVSAAIAFSQAVIDAFRNKFKARSPAKAIIEEVIIPIVQAFEKLRDFTGRGVSAGKSFASSVMDSITGEVPDVVDKTRQASAAGYMPGERSDLATRLASFTSRLSSKPSLSRKFANLAGEDISSSPAISEAIYRKGYEAGQIVPAKFLPVGERVGLRGTAGLPGGGLEDALRASAFSRASRTGAFVGPLAEPARSTSGILDPRGQAFGASSLPSGAPTGTAGIFDAQVANAQKVTDSVYSMVGKNTFRDFSQQAAQITAKSKPGFVDELRTNARMASADILGKAEAASASVMSKGRSGIAAAAQRGLQAADEAQSLISAGSGGVVDRAKQGVRQLLEFFRSIGDFVAPNYENLSREPAKQIRRGIFAEGGPTYGKTFVSGQGEDRYKLGYSEGMFGIPDDLQDIPLKGGNKIKNALESFYDKIVATLGGAGGGGPRPPVGGGPGGGFYSDPDDLTRRAAEAAQQGPEGLLGLKELAAPAKVSTKELEALSAILKEFRSVLDPTIQGFDRLDNQLRETTANLDRQVQRRAPDADFLTRRVGPRAGSAISEGLIGGAFPLLFGQGIGASVGGGLGGAAGGFLGGGLGFGLSLIGTALGTAFDTAVQSATELGVALNDVSTVFDKVKERSLFSSRETEKYAAKLQQAGLVASASALAQREIIEKIGVSGVEELRALEESSDKVGRAWAELNVQLQRALAGPMAQLLTWVTNIITEINKSGRSEAQIEDIRNALPQEGKNKLDRVGVAGNPLLDLFGFIAGVDVPKLGAFPGDNPFASKAARAQQLASSYGVDPAQDAIKTKPEQVRDQAVAEAKAQIDALNTQLEAIDIGKKLTDQIRETARQQEDLNQQAFDTRRQYEEAIGDIRLNIERTAQRESLDNVRAQNELYQVQGEIRLQQLSNASQALVSEQGVNDYGRRLLEILGQAASLEVSTQQDIENKRRQFQLEIQSKEIDAEIFKSDIAKQVAKLGEDSQKRIAEINKGVRRSNEQYDLQRFKIEKTIAGLRVKQIEAEIQFNKDSVEAELKQAQSDPSSNPKTITYFQNLLKVYEAQTQAIEKSKQTLSDVVAPAKLQEVGGFSTQGVSTVALDAVRERAAAFSRELLEANENLIGLARAGQWQEIKNQFAELADQGYKSAVIELQDIVEAVANGGDAFAGAAARLAEADKLINDSLNSIGGKLETSLVKEYRAGGLTDEKIRLLLQLASQFNLLAFTQANAAKTAKFYADSISAVQSQIESLTQEIKEATDFGSNYEQALRSLADRGLSLVDKEARSLVDAAQRLDVLEEKAAVLRGIQTASEGLAGSMRGLIENFYELGSASEAVKAFGEEMSKKALGFVLDIAFKPVEENIRKSLIMFGEKIGFDFSTPAERQLTVLEQANGTIAGIKTTLDALVAKIVPSQPAAVAATAPAAANVAPIAQAVSQPASMTTGAQATNNIVLGPAVQNYLKQIQSIQAPFIAKELKQGSSRDEVIARGEALKASFASEVSGLSSNPEIRNEITKTIDNLILTIAQKRIQEIGASASQAGAGPGAALLTGSGAPGDPMPLPVNAFGASSEAVQQVREGLGAVNEATAASSQSLTTTAATATKELRKNNAELAGAVPEWGKNLGGVVSGLSLAATGVIGILGGIQQIKEGGTSNVLSGIGSILTTIGGIGLSVAGMIKKPAANGAAFANGMASFAKGGTFTNSIVSSPTLFKFANGGTTQMGEMGEAGPEAIMPLSRGRGGRLGVDASGLREAMGRPSGGAGGSPVLNMSFQSTTINGVEYVSRDQLEQAMAATRRQAASDGANRGMSMTLDKLQQSPSTRSRLGIGGR